jgi:hypothetical protein
MWFYIIVGKLDINVESSCIFRCLVSTKQGPFPHFLISSFPLQEVFEEDDGLCQCSAPI